MEWVQLFKTSFAKYLTAFVLIILVSFLILSSIITSIIRSFVSSETDKQLADTSSIIAEKLEEMNVESIATYGCADIITNMISPIINYDGHYNVLVADEDGRIIITTALPECLSEDGNKTPLTDLKTGYGYINTESFKEKELDGDSFLVHNGNLGGILDSESVVYAHGVVTEGELRGYVLAATSNEKEMRLVSITRSAVINSSIWVMLAAVIATYFITERIIHPLRTMTGAAKKFAKGDFSARVTVYGKDEVSELGNAFNNMAESLDSLEKMRNSFLANISHDLRTPMTTIAGFIDGINSGAIPPEKHQHYLGVISAEVHRLSRLVSQILDVSRLESGERKFVYTDFDIAEMARIILISFEKKIDEKRLDVEFNTEDDVMSVYADKDAIYQVMYNLCHNAIKFASDGGKFAINIKRIGGKKICASVYDQGQSIAEEDSKMVFDRFYKTDKSRGLDKSGVGLGLYISKTIIDAHGERIWVESNEGEGTEFFFTLREGAAISKHRGAPEQK